MFPGPRRSNEGGVRKQISTEKCTSSFGGRGARRVLSSLLPYFFHSCLIMGIRRGSSTQGKKGPRPPMDGVRVKPGKGAGSRHAPKVTTPWPSLSSRPTWDANNLWKREWGGGRGVRRLKFFFLPSLPGKLLARPRLHFFPLPPPPCENSKLALW